MVTKEGVDKARVKWRAAANAVYTAVKDTANVSDAAVNDAEDNANAAWDEYIEVIREYEDVQKARAIYAKADDAEAAALAAADVDAIEAALAAATEAAEEAWEEYVKLKEEFENANSRRC